MFCLRLVLLRLLRFKISAGTRPQPWAPERQWASSRSQWALPDLNHAPELSGHCRTSTGSDLNHKLQISARWASTASSRSQWALPDLNRKLQISVGTARPQPPAPDLSGHKMGRFVWSWTGYTRGCIYLLNLVALGTWWVCHLLGKQAPAVALMSRADLWGGQTTAMHTFSAATAQVCASGSGTCHVMICQMHCLVTPLVIRLVALAIKKLKQLFSPSRRGNFSHPTPPVMVCCL